MKLVAKPQTMSFWITNISDRDVSLSDLNISIKAMSSVNLLDHNHYPHLTLEILQNSEKSGSLFKKQNKLRHRIAPPPETIPTRTQLYVEAYIPSRQHSDLQIVQETYKELEIIDDDTTISNLTDIATNASPTPTTKITG